jgi:hypothetical protein
MTSGNVAIQMVREASITRLYTVTRKGLRSRVRCTVNGLYQVTIIDEQGCFKKMQKRTFKDAARALAMGIENERA